MTILTAAFRWIVPAALLLYAGPVLSGLARHDWQIVPLLAVLMLGWHAARLRAQPMAISPTLLFLLAVTALVWGAAGGVGKLLGLELSVGWALPLALTTAGAVLSVFATRFDPAMDKVLDDAIRDIERADAASARVVSDEDDPNPRH